MNNAHPIALLAPSGVGIAAIICTILIHAMPLSATVTFVTREKKLGHVGVSAINLAQFLRLKDL